MFVKGKRNSHLKNIIQCIIIQYISIGWLISLKHYKVKKFSTEAKKADVSDVLLSETMDEFLSIGTKGQQKLSLGAGLYKLRLATKEGKGKSGGSRSILAFKKESRVIWLHLFSKNDKGNVTTNELKKLKSLSDILLSLPDNDIEKLITLGELYEVNEHA